MIPDKCPFCQELLEIEGDYLGEYRNCIKDEYHFSRRYDNWFNDMSSFHRIMIGKYIVRFSFLDKGDFFSSLDDTKMRHMSVLTRFSWEIFLKMNDLSFIQTIVQDSEMLR